MYWYIHCFIAYSRRNQKKVVVTESSKYMYRKLFIFTSNFLVEVSGHVPYGFNVYLLFLSYNSFKIKYMYQ